MAKNQRSFLEKTVDACRQAFVIAGIFSLFVNILMLTVPLYMLQLFDRVFASYSLETLFYLTLVAIVALVVYALLDMARTRIFLRVSSWLDRVLGPEAVMRSPDEILQGRLYGAQALIDLRTIRGFISSSGIFAIFDSPWIPIYLFVIFILHPYLGILSAVGAILLFVLAIINEMVTHHILAEANKGSILSQRQIDASLRNAEVIQSMGMMPNIVKHWQRENNRVLALQSKVNDRSGVIISISKFTRLLLQLIMLGLGAYLVVDNTITPGAMIAASILMSRALAPIEQSIVVWKQLISSYTAYKRLKVHFKHETERSAGIELPAPIGKLECENLVYIPIGQKKPILTGINLLINPGEVIALIGPTGAGKSTLARLIVGAWQPTYGKVRLDDADVFAWDRPHFGKYVGYLPQDVELFMGTVKDNIARLDVGNDKAIDKAIIEAAKLSGIHQLILHFPNGYDTEIMTGKITLSGGQRQRIALARALYGNPKLIVLDEPNANLDAQGEDALANAIIAMKEKGSTQIIITHRPNLLKLVDKIVFLKDGMIQLQGEREEVLRKLQQTTDSRPEIRKKDLS